MKVNGQSSDSITYTPRDFELSLNDKLSDWLEQLPDTRWEDDILVVAGHRVGKLYINHQLYENVNWTTLLGNIPAKTVVTLVLSKYRDANYEEEQRRPEHTNAELYALSIQTTEHLQWSGGLEGGWGNGKRFQSKAYLNGLTTDARFSFYAALNNINIKPSFQKGEWENNEAGEGVSLSRAAGGDYSLRKGKHRMYGHLALYNNDDDLSRENLMRRYGFMPTPYFLGMFNSCNKTAGIGTRQTWEWENEQVTLKISPAFSYQRLRSYSDKVDGAFWHIPDVDFWEQVLEHTESYHRQQRFPHLGYADLSHFSRRRAYDVDLFFTWKPVHQKALLTIQADQHFEHNSRKSFTDYDIVYAKAASQREQYYGLLPEQTHVLHWQISYAINKGNFRWTPAYQFSHRYTHAPQTYYRLDYLRTPEEIFTTPIEVLPADFHAQKAMALDVNNSYQAKIRRSDHIFRSSFTCFLQGQSQTLQFIPSVHQRITRWRYQRGKDIHGQAIDRYTKEHKFLFEPALVLTLGKQELSYRHYYQQPNVLQTLSIRDTVRPLYHVLGNPDLHDIIYDVFAWHGAWRKENGLSADVKARWNIKRGDIVNAVVYELGTGRITTQPTNMNGCWDIDCQATLHTPLDAQRQFILNGEHHMRYANAAQRSGYTANEMWRNSLQHFQWQDDISLDWHKGKNLYGLMFNMDGNVAKSPYPGWTALHTLDFLLGVKTRLHLTKTTEFSTDLSYGRRWHYPDYIPAHRWIWNAEITQSFLHEHLLMTLSSSDILDQDPAIVQNITASGRDLVLYDGLIRYAMLSAAWRF